MGTRFGMLGHRSSVALACAALGFAVPAIAHVDPPSCDASGVSLTVSAYRRDGVTGLVGAASECEHVVYQVRLRKAAPGACAVSGGTLTLTTPDGVVHTLADPVPCFGGQVPDTEGGAPADCRAEAAGFTSRQVEYDVRPADAIDGFLRATVRYAGAVAHDNRPDTPGVGSTSLRHIELSRCDDGDPCTVDLCDPAEAAGMACSSAPRCDDGDPATTDACSAGACVFTPIASSARVVCGP